MASIDLKKITIGQIPGAPSDERLIGEIFAGTKYKAAYEPNMEDYLLCHAAFVLPVAFACCKADGDLKKRYEENVFRNIAGNKLQPLFRNAVRYFTGE